MRSTTSNTRSTYGGSSGGLGTFHHSCRRNPARSGHPGHGTIGDTRGAESDISKLSADQKLPLGLVLGVTSALLAVVPIVLAIDRLYRRDTRRVVDSVLAAAMAYLAAVGLNATVSSHHMLSAIRDA